MVLHQAAHLEQKPTINRMHCILTAFWLREVAKQCAQLIWSWCKSKLIGVCISTLCSHTSRWCLVGIWSIVSHWWSHARWWCLVRVWSIIRSIWSHTGCLTWIRRIARSVRCHAGWWCLSGVCPLWNHSSWWHRLVSRRSRRIAPSRRWIHSTLIYSVLVTLLQYKQTDSLTAI